jgi:hypothetical protein
MATKLWHVPVRVATGLVILDQGLSKLAADEDRAAWLHERAVTAFPQLKQLDPKDFAQLLSACEITLGGSLLAIGIVPSGLAGLGLAGFGGALTRLYFSAPGMRREGTLAAPSQQGITLVKDSWMLAIGTALVLDALFGPRRKRRRRRPRRR